MQHDADRCSRQIPLVGKKERCAAFECDMLDNCLRRRLNTHLFCENIASNRPKFIKIQSPFHFTRRFAAVASTSGDQIPGSRDWHGAGAGAALAWPAVQQLHRGPGECHRKFALMGQGVAPKPRKGNWKGSCGSFLGYKQYIEIIQRSGDRLQPRQLQIQVSCGLNSSQCATQPLAQCARAPMSVGPAGEGQTLEYLDWTRSLNP